MPRFKPRIVIIVSTATEKWEFSTVKGRPLTRGVVSPGPSKQQLKIAYKAIADISKAEPKP